MNKRMDIMGKSFYNLKVALISNNKYDDGLKDLEGANFIAEKLNKYFCSAVNDSDKDIINMQNIKNSEGTKLLFDFIKKHINKDDIFLFYYCGHGKILSNDPSELILAMSDTSVETFESIGIKFSDLTKKITEAKIDKFICILDCCCSGTVVKNAEKDITFSKNVINDNRVYISSVKGTLDSYEIEVEKEKNKVPFFSYYLWKSFIEESDDGKTWFSVDQIFEKTKKYMNMENNNLGMEPQISRKNSLCSEKIFPCINYKHDFEDLLDVIDWRITSRCDNLCGMCYACNDNNLTKEIPIDKIESVMDKISNLNCKSICVSGGEPTIVNHFEKVIQGLYNRGFSIFLSTNGYKYFEHRNEIEQCIDKLSLPLDGYDEYSNRKNGRNEDSFKNVKKVLDYYQKHKHSFPIKISTVLTRNTNDINHLKALLSFLKGYDISIWKIYEFIPENRGVANISCLETSGINKVKNWINTVKKDCNFKIELVRREKRNAAYFIIQPNGDVIIPIEDKNKKIVFDKKVGNIIDEENINSIIHKWSMYVDKENYFTNMKLRKIKQKYWLKPSTKKILYTLLSKDTIPSLEEIAEELRVDLKIIKDEIYALYERRIIKRIIPIINLKMFKINTFLATLKFAKYATYPEGYIDEYLSYNAHIGWITKCEKKTYRIAIFAYNKQNAIDILTNIQTHLNKEVQYEFHDLKCSYAIRERNLFSDEHRHHVSADMYNSNVINVHDDIKISYEEFYALKQIEVLRKPLKENLDEKSFLVNYINLSSNINSLMKKGVIEQISISLDTRLLGYEWYIIFVQISNSKIEELINYLRVNFNNVTHINSLIPYNSNNCNLDFEVHVLSLAEVEKIVQEINTEFGEIVTTRLKIIQECVFSFLPHFVSDVILKKYVENNKGEIIND